MLKIYFTIALRDSKETINNRAESSNQVKISNQIENVNLDVERGEIRPHRQELRKAFLVNWKQLCLKRDFM